MLVTLQRREFLRVSGAVCVLLSLLAWPAHAHEGPPFPVIVDQQIGSMVVSVWADPDIGTGVFFIVLEPVAGGTLPEDITVAVGVWPVSGRLEEARYQATPEAVRYGARYVAEVAFDQGEWWNVRIAIESATGGGELNVEVEATPDGSIGPIGLIVYLLPFLAVGGLWLKAVLHRRGAAAS
jgi:hypothetical protein